MDPASAAALVALLTQGGPWAVVVVVLTLVLRVWRSGEFLPKPVHDALVAAARQRYEDMVERYKASQDGLLSWREEAKRATTIAEQAQAGAQSRQEQIIRLLSDYRGSLEQMQREVVLLRDELRERGVVWDNRGGREQWDREERERERPGRGRPDTGAREQRP